MCSCSARIPTGSRRGLSRSGVARRRAVRAAGVRDRDRAEERRDGHSQLDPAPPIRQHPHGSHGQPPVAAGDNFPSRSCSSEPSGASACDLLRSVALILLRSVACLEGCCRRSIPAAKRAVAAADLELPADYNSSSARAPAASWVTKRAPWGRLSARRHTPYIGAGIGR